MTLTDRATRRVQRVAKADYRGLIIDLVYFPEIGPARTPPRHGDVHDRTEEEEHDELGKAALHSIILRPRRPSPAVIPYARHGTKGRQAWLHEQNGEERWIA